MPWAESGTRTYFLGAPAFTWAARIIRQPVSSPLAPAEGWSVTRAKPVRAIRAASRRAISSSAPWERCPGVYGWTSAKPASRAISSLIRGLCFIVHDPSG